MIHWMCSKASFCHHSELCFWLPSSWPSEPWIECSRNNWHSLKSGILLCAVLGLTNWDSKSHLTPSLSSFSPFFPVSLHNSSNSQFLCEMIDWTSFSMKISWGVVFFWGDLRFHPHLLIFDEYYWSCTCVHWKSSFYSYFCYFPLSLFLLASFSTSQAQNLSLKDSRHPDCYSLSVLILTWFPFLNSYDCLSALTQRCTLSQLLDLFVFFWTHSAVLISHCLFAIYSSSISVQLCDFQHAPHFSGSPLQGRNLIPAIFEF